MADKNRFFPHLLPHDIEVWEADLAARPNAYLRIEYDVRVGRGRDPGPDFSDDIRRHTCDLSCRRIDAVGHAVDHIDIIEITQRAGLKALGQLAGYPLLYALTFKPTLPLRQVLVAAELGTDMVEIFSLANLTVFLYPERIQPNANPHSNRD